MAPTIWSPLQQMSLFKSGKAIDGVPQFKSITLILDTCPTCIRAKQTKAHKQQSPPKMASLSSSSKSNPHTTKLADCPRQGSSIDFSFAGMNLKNGGRRKDHEGLNWETAWILITNRFTSVKRGDSQTSEVALALWMKHFLAQHDPKCQDECVCVHQGRELFDNPEAKNVPTKSGCTTHPTGANTSNQNVPLERNHQTMADMASAFLAGANLFPKL